MPHESLRQLLGKQYEDLLVRQAETIRDWPAGPERQEKAEIHIRLALWERQTGRIGDETQFQVYSILSFVMPKDGAFDDEQVPLQELERETAWEVAYHEELERRSCPECGDGSCPATE